MKNTTTRKTKLRITARISVLLMVFGIGYSLTGTIFAATPASNATLQPASGAAEFRAEDGSTSVVNETHAADGEAAHDDAGSSEAEAGIVGMFGINWKLLLAQFINFAIVVFVLWKWVFKPVTSGLSARTEKIENSLKDAEKITKDRETFDSWKQGEMSVVRAEAAGILTQAKADAEALKASTLQATADEQAKLLAQAQTRLEQEKASMLTAAKAELADIVVTATSIILKEKIDSSKDKALIEDALKKAQS